MRFERLSPKRIEANFNFFLQEAIDVGRRVGSSSGLDEKTRLAINAVSEAFPNVDSSLIQNARKEFAKQLDGTHRQEGRDMWAGYPPTQPNS
jgi:hypothetical protein